MWKSGRWVRTTVAVNMKRTVSSFDARTRFSFLMLGRNALFLLLDAQVSNMFSVPFIVRPIHRFPWIFLSPHQQHSFNWQSLTHKEKLVLNFSEQSCPSPLLVHVSNFPHPCSNFQGTKSPKCSPLYSLYSAKASILFPTPNSSDLHGLREEALLRSSPTTTAVKDFSSFTHSSC